MKYSFGLIILLASCSVGISHDSEKMQQDTFVESIDDDIPSDEENSVPDQDSGLEEPEESEDSVEDFIFKGPHDVSVTSTSAPVTDCNIDYAVYTPSNIDNPPVAILAHGFARGSETMVGWAEHLSSWGVEVLLPTLCHYNILLGVDHEMNGLNLVELGQYHGSSEVVYAGHSAGGLASIIAASLDNNNLGILGLDTTDTEGTPGVPDFIGQQYAEDVTSPAFFVRGEPSTCNSSGNGLDLFEMMQTSYKIKVDEADHCDFEYPTNFGCEISCENSDAITSDEEIRSVIITLGTSAILSLTGISDDGWILWSGS